MDNITKEQMQAAFEAWENGFRVEPEKFRTHEECAALGIDIVSAERTDYFWELIKLEQAKA
jgi:hypothetical protein